jgi:hypothetical protein
MDSFIHQRFPLVGGFLVATLLLFTAAPARAATAPESARCASAVAPFAEGSLKSFFTGGSARDRIVQMCVLCMAAALFILMKKFVPDAPSSRSGDPSRTRAAQEKEDPAQLAGPIKKTAP